LQEFAEIGMKTVLFTGAGLSAEAGLPTMSQFARACYGSGAPEAAEAKWLGRLDQDERYAIWSAIEHMRSFFGRPEEEAFNIEWVLGQLEMMRATFPERAYSMPRK
jgi:NAD-dependent SIR2 family protein deacetylase